MEGGESVLILIVLMVSMIATFINFYKIVCCQYGLFIDDNCISVKLFSQLPLEILQILFKLPNYPIVQRTLWGMGCANLSPSKAQGFFPSDELFSTSFQSMNFLPVALEKALC